jgi:ribosomal protein S12 methylthiotransferase accessory factor
MLALSLDMKEEALESSEWLINFNQLPAKRAKLYRAISTILRTDLDDELSRENLTSVWKLIFGEETLKRALGLIDREEKFDAMPEEDLSLSSFKKHQLLLEAYEKLQIAKRKHC